MIPPDGAPVRVSLNWVLWCQGIAKARRALGGATHTSSRVSSKSQKRWTLHAALSWESHKRSCPILGALTGTLEIRSKNGFKPCSGPSFNPFTTYQRTRRKQHSLFPLCFSILPFSSLRQLEGYVREGRVSSCPKLKNSTNTSTNEVAAITFILLPLHF